MKSIWTETTTMPRRNPLPGNCRTDTAVIGGGLAGVLTAHYLKEQGREVIVLEANRVGSGQSGYTTAKITSQHNLIYQKLVKTAGKEYAIPYAAANQSSILEYEKLIRRKHVDCEFERKAAYLFSLKSAHALKKEAEFAAMCGIPAEFLRETELPFPVAGAVRFPDQAQFHPLKFIEAISKDLTIYERTLVKAVKGHSIITDRGVVHADHVVFACHYPFVNVPGFYFLRMFQEKSYVLGLGPVKPLSGMYLGIDKDSYSLRSAGDTLLLGHGSHRTGKVLTKNPYEEMKRFQKRFYPDAKERGRWSAEDCMSVDGIPFIGRFSALRPDWYIASGFGKWGMTTSMVAARMIAAQIGGRKTPFDEMFTPARLRLRLAMSSFPAHAAKSAGGLLNGILPDVSRCPHMGCRLVYNKADGRYECPCHGSQFDQSGKLCCGPAQESLPFID